jgi:hypothetical protein
VEIAEEDVERYFLAAHTSHLRLTHHTFTPHTFIRRMLAVMTAAENLKYVQLRHRPSTNPKP